MRAIILIISCALIHNILCEQKSKGTRKILHNETPLFPCALCQSLETMAGETGKVPEYRFNQDEEAHLPIMTAEIFIKKHAYSGIPAIVRGVGRDWAALSIFSLEFFRDFYFSDIRRIHHVEQDCWYADYNSGLDYFRDFLLIDNERDWNRTWYVGWHDCDHKGQTVENTSTQRQESEDKGTPKSSSKNHKKRLSDYYRVPEFLNLESAGGGDGEWIFIGSPGHGAKTHVDVVYNPSWQVQIAGEKIWRLYPGEFSNEGDDANEDSDIDENEDTSKVLRRGDKCVKYNNCHPVYEINLKPGDMSTPSCLYHIGCVFF